MRGARSLLIAVLAATPAVAQMPDMSIDPAAVTATPSKAALELARAISKSEAWQRWDITPQRAREALLNSTIHEIRAYKPQSCDPNEPACRQAAERIVDRNVPEFVEAIRRERLAGYAVRFDQIMSAEEIRSATAFTLTPGGVKFASVLLNGAFDMTIAARTMTAANPIKERTYDAFYEATKAMPRRVLIAPPPPIQITPPPIRVPAKKAGG